MLLHHDINVVGKKVVDLGCGTGIVGMTAVLMGAAKILFSDSNPAYFEHFKNYPLYIDIAHNVEVQSGLSKSAQDVNF